METKGILGIENNIKEISESLRKIRRRNRIRKIIAIIGLAISILGASYLIFL